MSTTTYTVLPGVRRARADKILAIAFREHSRVAFHRSFDSGLVRMGGKPITRDHSVSEGDVLEFTFPDTRPAGLRAVDIPLEILFEDRHLPAGLLTASR